jgi:dTDP-4-amino-4,6-dideoxygalactose transaminase
MKDTNHLRNCRLPAVLGGEPSFDRLFNLVYPVFPDISDVVKHLEYLSEARMLTNQGGLTQKLEHQIASKLSVKHCALFCNGTIAQMCLFKCLQPDGLVLVPSFTFPSTVESLHWMGINTHFIDINRETLLMDPTKIDKEIAENSSVILAVNLFGHCCDHDLLRSIAHRYGVKLIYDSAQAFGSLYKGRPVGSLGDAEFFSFHATKTLHTFEGGAVVTNDTSLYKKLCKIRNFGFTEYLDFDELGINGKMHELSAAVGLILIDHEKNNLAKRKNRYQHYLQRLKIIPGIEFVRTQECISSNYSYLCLIIEPSIFGLNNLELNYALLKDNIATRCYYFPPVHRSSYFQKLATNNIEDLPNTDLMSMRTLCIPLHSEMSVEEIEKIVFAIDNCGRHAESIRRTISGKVPSTWRDLYQLEYRDPARV